MVWGVVDRMRWRRSAGRPVAAALAALVLAAPLAPARACPPGLRGEPGDRLRVGYAPLAPFVLRPGTDGQVRGFSMELLRTMAERAGWSLELTELAPDTLHRRIADCQIDVGVVGVPVSAGLANDVDLSQTYLVSATTVVVHADDLTRAGASAGESRSGRIAHAGLHGLLWGLVALALLALSSWLLNVATRRRGRLGLRWRRADPTVSGPVGGLRWLWRSSTGRVLAALWIAAGLVFGVTGRTVGAVKPLHLGGDPLGELVEQAADTENLIGERMPDGQHVTCSSDGAAACFRAFEDHALAAVAGPREVLCSHVLDLGLERVVLRDDLAVPERYAFLLPPDSPLRLALNRAILEMHQERGAFPPTVSCPGGPR
jgi:ABC-type amino acid transport substrate-binding protein